MGVAGIVISRGLKYEAILLMIFAFILVYVFIDDTKPTENGTVQKRDEDAPATQTVTAPEPDVPEEKEAMK